MSVVIVGARKDPQAKRVHTELRKLGEGVDWLDAPAFPQTTRIALDGATLRIGRRSIDRPKSVYLRSLATHPSGASDRELKARPRGVIAQADENAAMLESLLKGWEQQGVRLVNSLEANAQHSRKPYQLELLGGAGLPLPEWVATNDPAAARNFVRRVGRAVYKPLAGGATVREVTKDDLSGDRLSALALAPVLFQALVEGVSVRAFVVGRRVVGAAEIQSSELDYRRREEAVVATRLSAAEGRAALAAAQVCGMAFTGVDLIRSAGDFVILECNPSPMFAVFEQKTGLDIAGPLARLLRRA